MDRALAWRDRLLASPRFQAWAERFPLTRFVARRRAKALFDLCAGFVYSQTLLACVRLRVFEILAEGPLAVDALGPRLGLSGPAASRLMEAAAALGLVERRSGSRWGLGALGAALLGNPAATAMIAHHPLLYADLQDPVACLRGETGGLSRYWAYARDGAPAGLEGREVGPYTELMAASQPLVARQVLDAVPLRGRRRLMDVGGGSGAFLAEAGARHPGLRLALFDLPPVAAEARTRFERHGFADRAEALGGDFRTDPLPPGADAISLVRVIHDHDDEAALAIMRNARSALEPGGVLILAEPMAGTPGAETVGAYFALYLHAMGSGRPRTAAELTGMLAQAGFARVRRVPTRMPLLCSVLVASAE